MSPFVLSVVSMVATLLDPALLWSCLSSLCSLHEFSERSLSHPPADLGVSGEEPQERDLLLPGKPCGSPTDTPVLATALEL